MKRCITRLFTPKTPRTPAQSPPRSLLENLEPRTLMAATPPVISSIVADNRGLVVLTVSKALSASTVTTSTCQLLTAGTDGKFNTADDVVQKATVSYNASARTITLKKPLKHDLAYRVRLIAKSIKSTEGVQLDGEFNAPNFHSGDGAPGGNFDIVTTTPATQIARWTTAYGTIDVKLFTSQTPTNVAAFMGNANDGHWDGTFFERSVANFVIQGGDFKISSDNKFIDNTATRGPIANEPGISNIRGRIAMPKSDGDPRPDPNGWFFNLGDNSQNLDFQNGGFTAFGEITNGAGRAVMDKIASLKRVNVGSPFDALPVNDLNKVIARNGLDPRVDSVAVTRVAMLSGVQATVPMQLAGSADFNGDGKPDLVWRNYATGANRVWYMNGNKIISDLALPAVPDLTQRLEAIADMNGDNKPDLIFRKANTGAAAILLMNGTSLLQTVSLGTLTDLNTQFVAAADFTGDGKADLLTRNYATGANQLWAMNRTARTAIINLSSWGDINQRLSVVGDFNGDGKQDIVFRNAASGANTLWLMNKTARVSTKSIQSQGDTNWYLEARGDFNANNETDLVWRNHMTGANQIWLMNDSTRVGLLGLPVA